MSEETLEQKENSEIANSDSLFSDSVLSEFTESEIETTLNRFADVFGNDGELLVVGFQNDVAFLDTFGSQYS